MVDISKFSFPVKPPIHADPSTDNIEIQFVPQFMFRNKKRECVTLESGRKAALDTRLNDISLNFDWTFQQELPQFDVDASAAMFTDRFEFHDCVWWDKCRTECKSLRFTSHASHENYTEFRESIKMLLQEIPNDVHYVVVTVNVYSKDHDLRHLQHISLDINSTNEHLIHYEWLGDGTPGRSLLMGCFVRKREAWEFHAMSKPLFSRTIAEIVHEPSSLNDIWTIPSSKCVRRHVVIQPIAGKDLTPMDLSLLSRRSDPYLKIFIDDWVTISAVCFGTLNPTFMCDSIDLGVVSENSMKIMEIQCWDHDKISKDDNMGVIKFCLGGLMSNVKVGLNPVWLKLFPTEKHIRDKTEITGYILCNVVVTEEAF